MEDSSARLNGFKPRSYGDLVAIAALLTMFVSAVAWGLKLEGELNAVRDEVFTLKGQVGNGILPRAEERIRSMERRVEQLEEHE